jgi:drug/metabolite transporter (DMT)-like permease
MMETHLRGTVCGLAAAALFGASAPVSKLLLPESTPLALAGILYLGAGIGLTLFRLAGDRADSCAPREAPLRLTDVPVLLTIIVAGGVLGPVLMLVGLQHVSGVAGSLLLTLEAPLTMLLAVTIFREHLGMREAWSAGLVLTGAALLAGGPGDLHASPVGVIAIGGACLSWALDNNLTQRLSDRDPVALVQMKTLGAGTFTTIVAWSAGQMQGSGVTIGVALVVGALSYGLSIVLDTYALRLLGAAREAALFATAPFAGAMLAVPLLGERLAATDVVAATSMVLGVVLLAWTRHAHLHSHEVVAHDHAHVHDEHHHHAHDGPVVEPHAHPHVHASLVHDHPHAPDSHHRHSHRDRERRRA